MTLKFLLQVIFKYEKEEQGKSLQTYMSSGDPADLILLNHTKNIINQVALECPLVKKFFEAHEVKEESLMKEILEYLVYSRSKFFEKDYEILGKEFLLYKEIVEGDGLKLVCELDNERSNLIVKQIINEYRRKDLETKSEK